MSAFPEHGNMRPHAGPRLLYLFSPVDCGGHFPNVRHLPLLTDPAVNTYTEPVSFLFTTTLKL